VVEKSSLSKKRIIKPGSSRSVVEKHELPSLDDVLGEDVNEAFSSLEKHKGAEGGGEKPATLNSIPTPPNPSGFDLKLAEEAPNTSPEGFAQPDPAALALAEQKANEMKEEAENILGNARAEAERLYEEAREEGFAEGMSQAQEAIKEEFLPVLQNLKQTITKIQELRTVILKQNESEIIDLAIDIARKILGGELEQNPISVAQVIRAALHKVDAIENITVKISPAEYETLMKNLPDFLKNTWIVADSNVSKGGAIIDTDTGAYDAQIDSQLHEIERKLKSDKKN